MKSFISVVQYNNKIHHSYIENGVRKKEVVNYQPIRGFITEKESEWKDVYGNNLSTTRFPDMKSCSEWTKEQINILDVYGDIQNVPAFITENYPTDIPIQKEHMNIYNFDLECNVGSAGGFPKASDPENYINAITFQNMVTNQYYVYSLKDYTPTESNVTYTKCKNEEDLLEHIIDFLMIKNVDILSGYNINAFDIPYIVDRITLVMGEDKAKRLSPMNKLRKLDKIVNKKVTTTYFIEGIIIADYIELYKKFVFDGRESYSLDYISQYELGAGKLEYKDEHGNLNTLYQYDFRKFIDYNIKDVELVYLLEQKLHFIDIAIGYAYSMKCNIDDIFGTLKPWDSLLFSILYNKKILCNPSKYSSAEEFLGGYVREPVRGMQKWVEVVDIISSYPNQIIQSNMSPETILSNKEIYSNNDLVWIKEGDWCLDNCIDIEKLSTIQETLEKYNVTYTCNGQFFRRDKQGFIPEIVESVFNERLAIKGKIKEAKKRNATKGEIEYLENQSLITKIKINSLYGAMATEYFRWYDIRIASAVTHQGQLCARGAGEYVTKLYSDIDWIYSDTDSLFFSLNKTVNQRFKNLPDKKTIAEFCMKYHNNVIVPTLKEFFAKLNTILNTFKPAVGMEFECLADVNIFIEKKKYVMQIVNKEGDWCLDNPKLKIKGIEVVRSSTPQCVRDKLKTALDLIFKTEDNDVLIDFIEEFRTEFYKLKYEQVAFPRGVNFSEYTLQSKSLPIAVRAAFIYNQALVNMNLHNKYLSIGDGGKIKFCYIKVPNVYRSDVIGVLDKLPEEMINTFKIDYPLQFKKAFLNPLEKIFDCIGWKLEKVNCLDDIFG